MPAWSAKPVILRLTPPLHLKAATSRRSAMYELYRNALRASLFLLVYLTCLTFCFQGRRVPKECFQRDILAYKNHRRIKLPSWNTWARWWRKSEESHERKWFSQKLMNTNQAWINLDQNCDDNHRNHLLDGLRYRNCGGNKQTKKIPTYLRLDIYIYWWCYINLYVVQYQGDDLNNSHFIKGSAPILLYFLNDNCMLLKTWKYIV